MRLIDADALIKDITESVIEVSGDSGLAEEAVKCYQAVILKYIDTINIINPEDCRTQGRWIGKYSPYAVNLHICSVCNLHLSFIGHLSDYNYCPHCGARMNGKEQGE